MILRKVFSPWGVLRYMHLDLMLSLSFGALAYVLYIWQGLKFSLPFSVTAILGSGLAIFIGFRNNSAYARWWEARTAWANIAAASRVLGRLIISFTDSHAHQANYERARSEAFKQKMLYYVIAWPHLLRLQLRGQKDEALLQGLVSAEDYALLADSPNPAYRLQSLMGQQIYEAMASGVLGGFDSFQMEGQLLSLANQQAVCERIKHTPLLRQYHFFIRVFLFAFMAVLPFALLGDLDKLGMSAWLIPVSMLISFVFAVMAKVGEVNEEPFENRITDVPLDALCRAIERDLRAALGEQNLPAELLAQDGVLM